MTKLTYSHRTGVPLIHLVVVNAATQMNLDLQHIIYDTMHYKLIIADSVTYSKQTVSKSSLVKILILANRPFWVQQGVIGWILHSLHYGKTEESHHALLLSNDFISRLHCTTLTFVQFGALYVQNYGDNHRVRRGSVLVYSGYQPQLNALNHRQSNIGTVILVKCKQYLKLCHCYSGTNIRLSITGRYTKPLLF